jgi:hypothetical protein
MFHARIPIVEKLMPSPATLAVTPILMQQSTSLVAAHAKIPQTMLESQPERHCVGHPAMAAQITEPPSRILRATMVGGVRHARQRKTADRAAASRAARRAVGSRLQAASCHQEVPPRTFDASRQRLKIQAGLLLDNRVRSGHMHEISSPAGIAEKLSGLFAPHFSMLGDFAFSIFKKLGMCNCACGGQ